MDSGLKGVTFSLFHNEAGTQLLYMYPPNVISNDEFQKIVDHEVVGTDICNKVIVIKLDSYQFLYCSAAIENPKYERNVLLFSFGFIMRSNFSTSSFEKILHKVTDMFVSLEVSFQKSCQIIMIQTNILF